MLGELNEDQINNILQSQTICRLGCIDGNQNYIVPISYFYDGTNLYAQSREGKKIDLMRNNPNVCIEVEIINSMNNWQSVIAYGIYEELKDNAANMARRKLFNHVLTLMTNSKIHKFQHQENEVKLENSPERLIMFCIKLNKKTGRFEK